MVVRFISSTIAFSPSSMKVLDMAQKIKLAERKAAENKAGTFKILRP